MSNSNYVYQKSIFPVMTGFIAGALVAVGTVAIVAVMMRSDMNQMNSNVTKALSQIMDTASVSSGNNSNPTTNACTVPATTTAPAPVNTSTTDIGDLLAPGAPLHIVPETVDSYNTENNNSTTNNTTTNNTTTNNTNNNINTTNNTTNNNDSNNVGPSSSTTTNNTNTINGGGDSLNSTDNNTSNSQTNVSTDSNNDPYTDNSGSTTNNTDTTNNNAGSIDSDVNNTSTTDSPNNSTQEITNQ